MKNKLFFSLPLKPPRSLSSFDTHARWLPVMQSVRSRRSYGKIGDCEQSAEMNKRVLIAGVPYPLSSIDLPFPLPPNPLPVLTPATQAKRERPRQQKYNKTTRLKSALEIGFYLGKGTIR